MKAFWDPSKKDLHPVLTGALLGFLLMPGTLVWSLLAGATIALLAIRYAVPATAAVSAKDSSRDTKWRGNYPSQKD